MPAARHFLSFMVKKLPINYLMGLQNGTLTAKVARLVWLNWAQGWVTAHQSCNLNCEIMVPTMTAPKWTGSKADKTAGTVQQYDGTNYCGFQLQANAPTIQSELEKALEKLTAEKLELPFPFELLREFMPGDRSSISIQVS